MLESVVAMCPVRATRRALGFSVDRCIQLKIPPCPVRPHRLFLAHLHRLLELRRCRKFLCLYDVAARCKITVGLWVHEYTRAGVHTMFLELWFQVITKTTVNWRSKASEGLHWKTLQGGVNRLDFVDPFTGECFSESSEYMNWWQYEDNPHLLIKPVHGWVRFRPN